MGSGGGKDPHFNSELEWIRFREDALGEYAFPVEGTTGKLSRKIKENPFVPLGAVATLAALTYGLWCFRQGRSQHSQYMMRARIGAQGLTVAAILGGFFIGAKGTTTEQKAAPTTPTPK
ncbi:HIG1 domain family member 2A, mitochondrial [Folsomia candida]|uniref:HIG1 domain family member 2A, mitochondrial n=1 Tax=Folsomia candida TaxID=158441 RepID=UPI000B8F2C8C|nr:HIG1 domain family member 2A, mitochondrial [Folsomia candida]XP_035714410.1 HIG1 domain family member 2A, mitochondrial [Folsomia candida]